MEVHSRAQSGPPPCPKQICYQGHPNMWHPTPITGQPLVPHNRGAARVPETPTLTFYFPFIAWFLL